VRNLADGRVQVEAEGEAAEVDAFVGAIGEKMHGFIRKAERSNAQRPAEFRGFTIR
jgi:acylphosphatase